MLPLSGWRPTLDRHEALPGRQIVRALKVALCLLFLVSTAAGAEYNYPFEDPYRATVFGTPRGDRAPLPEEVPVEVRSLDLQLARERLPVFWNLPSFRYSVALQDEPAPLIFVIAGTGARFDSAKNAYLQAVLYGAGMSVVNLSSPTHPDFVVTGSASAIPGFMEEDVRDLYAVMQSIALKLREEVEITGFLLTGYSLGATEAAFLGELDSREGAFGFEQILLLNPAVSLYASVNRLDRFVVENLPGGGPELAKLVDDLFEQVTDAFHERKPGRGVDEELLFQIGEATLTRPELEVLIGVSFRISLARMLFSSDIETRSGHLVAPDTKLTRATPLLPYFKAAGRWSVSDYMNDVLLPYWQDQVPGTTRAEAIEADSFVAIEDYLIRASNVSVMHNEDDLILDADEVEYLRRVFGERATLYPTGGHCGNLMYRDNVEHMIALLGGEGPAPSEGAYASLAATGEPPRPPRALRRITPEEAAETPGFLDVYDPLEGANRRIYFFNAKFDQYVFLPVVRGYEFVLPRFVRSGIHNVFTTVGEVTTLANSILQLRPRKSAETLGRLVVNLTVGVGGLWDAATKFGMPDHDEGFAQTLGFYRVPAGPYLVVPVLGPSSLRGATGSLVDAAPYFVLPIPPYVGPVAAIDTRAHTAFRYQEVGAPFEYEMVRFLSRAREELLIPR
jgi:ABC-type transporter lipoprotein component MlaA